MVVIKAVVLKHQEKEDGTFNVKYRITHNRKSAYIASPHFIHRSELTDKYKFKPSKLTNKIDREVLDLRDKVSELSSNINHYSAKEVAEALTKAKNEKSEVVDFLKHLESEYKQLESDKKLNAASYKAVYNRLYEYTKGRLYCHEITPMFLTKFEKNLYADGLTSSGIIKYMGCIRAAFNRAKDLYNDEDRGLILIPNNPFSKYKVPKESEADKRDAGIDIVLDLYFYEPETGLQELAKDLFFLSFYLIGINARDLHSSDIELKDGRLIYQRSKTKDKRSDRAEISIKIEPEVEYLINKYKGFKDNVFNLSERFNSSANLNLSLSRGFKQIRENIKIRNKQKYKNLTYYSARHSWATIASHNCDIIDSHIAKCLNHVSLDFKTTNRYIKKDWSTIDKCNRQVLDFVKQAIEGREKGSD